MDDNIKTGNMLKCFEEKVQSDICGLVTQDNVWRIRQNRNLKYLFGSENIGSTIKSARLRRGQCM